MSDGLESVLIAATWDSDPAQAAECWRFALYEEPLFRGLTIAYERCTSQSNKAQPISGVGEEIAVLVEDARWLRDRLTEWLEKQDAARTLESRRCEGGQ